MSGRLHVPFPLRADAYTIAGSCLISQEAKNYSCYSFVNRYSPAQAWPEVAKDSRMVLYGLSDFINNHLSTPITRQDVTESVLFMSQAKIGGLPLKFDHDMWLKVVDIYDGYLPINITSLPECSTFFPNEPIIQVENSAIGYGELAATIEALLVGTVSIATAAVTLRRHWLERIIEWLSLEGENNAYDIARWYIHDFGMRASSCAEESELLGRAHLLVFNGTDTFNAAYQAWRMGGDINCGKSILALAHRIVQSYPQELDCYTNLANQDNIGAYVADCYSFKQAVKDMLIPLAKQNPDKIISPRSDSGNAVENTEFVINELKKVGTPENVKLVHGDSVTPEIMEELIDTCKKHGMNPSTFLIFGVGGYLRNNVTRDSLSSSYKLGSCGNNRPVVKLSENIGKLSVPSPNMLARNKLGYSNNRNKTVFLKNENTSLHDARVSYVYNGTPTSFCVANFETLRKHTINNFDDMYDYPPDYGVNGSCWSEGIKQIQKEYMERYRKS